jgi:hypothetical protein
LAKPRILSIKLPVQVDQRGPTFRYIARTIRPFGGQIVFGLLDNNTSIDPSSSESDQLPIFLKKGNFSFGSVHIEKKHLHWVRTTKMSVPELVYTKLRQRGRIFTTEASNKNKLSMRIAPEALIVLELVAIGSMPHWSVTTMYKHPYALDGQEIGKYYPAWFFVLSKRGQLIQSHGC